jgi:hypothetical protein
MGSCSMMVPGRIEPQTTVTIPGRFTDEDGTLIDPTTVVFRTYSPLGVEATYTYGTDDEIEKVSTGVYNADFDVGDDAGRWHWRWQVTDGFILAARQGSFVVQSSPWHNGSSSDAYR